MLAPTSPQKVCDENETKKNNVHIKMLFMEGSLYSAHTKDMTKTQNKLESGWTEPISLKASFYHCRIVLVAYKPQQH